MNKFTSLLTGVILMACSAVSGADVNFQNLDWKEKVTENNLTISTAEVPGYQIKAFKAVSTYEASMAQMVAVITDMTHFTDWMEGALEAHVIKRFNNKSQACYYVNDIPFPLKERDGVIVQTIRHIDDKNISIDLTPQNELAEERKKYTRVNHFLGNWILKEVDEGKVELTYQIHLDPAGMIPDWVVNLMITNTPKKTLKKLHEVDLSRYGKDELNFEV